jgi:hypothetical protein
MAFHDESFRSLMSKENGGSSAEHSNAPPVEVPAATESVDVPVIAEFPVIAELPAVSETADLGAKAEVPTIDQSAEIESNLKSEDDKDTSKKWKKKLW